VSDIHSSPAKQCSLEGIPEGSGSGANKGAEGESVNPQPSALTYYERMKLEDEVKIDDGRDI
jgi:hypothetical protein